MPEISPPQASPNLQTAPTENTELAKVFCIDGYIVKIPLKAALQRLPYDIMEAVSQPIMRTALDIQGKDDVHFLTPMTKDMLLMDFPGAELVENINKTTANIVAGMHGGNPVFGDDHDGILR